MIYAESLGYDSLLEIPEFKILHRMNDANSPTAHDVDPDLPIPTITFPTARKLIELFHVFLQYCPNALKRPNLMNFISAYMTISRNAFSQVSQGKCIGVYVLSSFANHDNNPNTNESFYAIGGIRYTANRLIKKGEEITIAYLEDSDPELLRLKLQAMFGIE